ncbi:MAG: ComF family protein [Bacteroidota bacterium]
MLRDFVALIYPHLCYACGRSLYSHEQCICTYCQYHLPKTHFELNPDNRLSRLFWGRVPLEGATAYYHFDKGNKVQRLVHHLKYRGKTEIGQTIGRLVGHTLREQPPYAQVDCVVPVPLHPRKQRKRGYNQSDFLAQGIAEGLQKPWTTDNLIRNVANPSQTRRSRFQRWKNVENIFALRQPQLLEGRHVLLVDDVITTGSTIEACATALLKVPNLRLSVAAMACT